MTHVPPQTQAPILALHGSASSGAIWHALVRSLEGRRVVLAPDLPGYGENAPIPDQSAEDRFGWLGEVISSLGGRVDLVGHSFGGAVAMVLANRYPNQVNAVVLYEPIVPPGPGPAPEMRDLWSLCRQMMRLDVKSAMALFCDFWSGPDSWRRLSPRARDRLILHYPSVMLDFRQVFTGQLDIAQPQFDGPLTIIRGDASPPLTRSMSERLSARYANARIELVSGPGHLGPATHADRVNALILDHLAGRRSGEAATFHGRAKDAA